MKIKELLQEMPYLGKETELPLDSDSKKTFISDEALARDYSFLGETHIVSDEIVNFYLLKKGPFSAVGVIDSKKPKSGIKSNKIILFLRFKKQLSLIKIPDEIKKRKLLQVDKVLCEEEFRNFGLASYLYALIVEKDFVIISDSSQLIGGKKLWIKIAKEAHLTNYRVYILDDEYGFKKDKDGKLIVYDGENIEDSDIWTSDGDFAGEHILLTLK